MKKIKRKEMVNDIELPEGFQERGDEYGNPIRFLPPAFTELRKHNDGASDISDELWMPFSDTGDNFNIDRDSAKQFRMRNLQAYFRKPTDILATFPKEFLKLIKDFHNRTDNERQNKSNLIPDNIPENDSSDILPELDETNNCPDSKRFSYFSEEFKANVKRFIEDECRVFDDSDNIEEKITNAIAAKKVSGKNDETSAPARYVASSSGRGGGSSLSRETSEYWWLRSHSYEEFVVSAPERSAQPERAYAPAPDRLQEECTNKRVCDWLETNRETKDARKPRKL